MRSNAASVPRRAGLLLEPEPHEIAVQTQRGEAVVLQSEGRIQDRHAPHDGDREERHEPEHEEQRAQQGGSTVPRSDANLLGHTPAG